MRIRSGLVVVSILVVAGAFWAGCGAEPEARAAPPATAAATTEAPPPPPQEPEDAGPWFTDEAEAKGITLLNRTGEPKKKQFIMSAVGPGAAVLDADGDGRLDVFVPNGSWLVGPNRDAFYQGDDRPRDALYIQQDDGTFRDEAVARGVASDRWAFGACAADLDNDGDTDLVVTNLNRNHLYVNDGTGKFTDVAPAAGVAGRAVDWSTGIAVGDFDRDGKLDLYIANYADMFAWMRDSTEIQRDPDTGGIVEAAVCDWQGLRVYCGPLGLPGQQDYLYRNLGGKDGELRFEDVTKAAGIHRPGTTTTRDGPLYGFQALFTDIDRDGWPDLYVANDSVPSFLFVNNRDGTFTECGKERGVAVGSSGEDMAGMGATTGDITGDGLPEIHKTNFAAQTNNVYLAERFGDRLLYRELSKRSGIRQVVYNDLGWAVLLVDFDNDGDQDVFYANGHVYPEVDDPSPNVRALRMSFEQLNRMFRNDSTAKRVRFTEVGGELGPGFALKKSSRGAVWWDYDDDGDVDLLVVNLNDRPNLLVNHHGNARGHWVRLRFVGDPAKKVNREGIGAWVKVTAGERVQHLENKRGDGFLGSHDPRMHVGLGAHAGPIEIEVTWPNGDVTKHVGEAVDREIVLELDGAVPADK